MEYATSLVESALPEVCSALKLEYELIRDAPNELEKLKRLRMVISNVQQDASNQDLSQQKALSDWLDEMKDAAYDAEDIIDIFNTEILRRRSNDDSRNTTCCTFARFLLLWVNDFSYTLISRHIIGRSVQKTLCRLADIARESKYHLPPSGRNIRENTSWEETDSYTGRDNVMGRENDLENVIQLLFKEETDTNVLVLTGMGGIGKTMLAKLVYNDSRADAKFGKRKLWVCVSENFDLPRILRLIIELIDVKRCKLVGLEALIKKLIDLLGGKMYLLVLDDVWANESLTTDSWSKMKSLFHNCKILVTTRNANITSAMSHRFYIHNVGCLPEEYCWSLFENMVSPDGIVREDLKKIGEKIVTRCKGVPLAVRVLGSMLRNKQDASDWLEVANDNFFDATIEGGNGISGILKFSYDNLPSKSRLCFVYCSIFPKDSKMRKMDLCQQWTGNGFISSLNEANEIFKDLLSRCFFQDVEYDDFGDHTTFKMHDLIHDLAQSIAKRHCGILDNSNEDRFLSDRKNIRYLSIDMGEEASNILIQLKEAQKLRTLQSFSPQIMNHQILVDCFSKLKFMRVLICRWACNIKEVPSSIDNLKLLRYVDFSYTDIKQLPETVCNLQNLQTLKVNRCIRLMAWPKKLWKLSELRHLENVGLPLKSMPVEMNKLSLLQTLSTFIVNDDGKNLNELRPLNHLRGTLRLGELHKTEGVSYENGILKEKTNMKSLVLRSRKNWDTAGHVLEALEPHCSLKSLEISNFGGNVFPTWMSDPSRQLVKVSLSNCQNCKKLPPFEHLQYLKVLELEKLTLVEGVEEVNGGIETKVFFPSLEKLVLSQMYEFRGWPKLVLKISLNNMPKLRTLKIHNCPKFKSLSIMKYLFSLQHLDISICKKLKCLCILKHLSSLQYLRISSCKKLKSLHNMKHLSSLQDFEIANCDNLGSLLINMGSLKHLSIDHCSKLNCVSIDPDCLASLKKLEIKFCQNLVSLLPVGLKERMGDEVNGGSVTEVLFPSLENLIIRNMGRFTGWPESTKFPKLKTLEVEYCSNLKHMPHIPTTLCDLVLRNCDNALLLKLFETHDLPSSLSTLKIGSISNLRHITDDYFENLTALRELDIWFCNELVSFSNTAMKHLSSLQHLAIYSCQKLESLPKIEHLSSLQYLRISTCEKLESLPNMEHLSSLQHLKITFCHNLGSLPDMKHLSSLQHLKISSCHNLGSLLINMGSLEHFGVYHCSKLNCVSIDPDCITSLEELEIKNCPNLVSLLPVGLKERLGDALIIEGCPGLVS